MVSRYFIDNETEHLKKVHSVDILMILHSTVENWNLVFAIKQGLNIQVSAEMFHFAAWKLLPQPFTSFMQSRIWGKAGHHVSGKEGKNYHQNHIFRAISIVGTTIWTHLVVGRHNNRRAFS